MIFSTNLKEPDSILNKRGRGVFKRGSILDRPGQDFLQYLLVGQLGSATSISHMPGSSVPRGNPVVLSPEHELSCQERVHKVKALGFFPRKQTKWLFFLITFDFCPPPWKIHQSISLVISGPVQRFRAFSNWERWWFATSS